MMIDDIIDSGRAGRTLRERGRPEELEGKRSARMEIRSHEETRFNLTQPKLINSRVY